MNFFQHLSKNRTDVFTCALCIFLLENDLYILKQETLHFNRHVGPTFMKPNLKDF